MGGVPKGLLAAPSGETLVQRWTALFAGLSVPCVLVGTHAAYAHLGLETLPDEPEGVGPLGGLVALLRRAGRGPVLAVACDMPHVSGRLIERLIAHDPEACIVAPRRGHGASAGPGPGARGASLPPGALGRRGCRAAPPRFGGGGAAG
jgi:molybdopterin-guanine dinucleotide biosynthesis protein A